ncbi:MAG: hypothetical protein AB7O79_08300 [Xanthobacteraceae bacterium]
MRCDITAYLAAMESSLANVLPGLGAGCDHDESNNTGRIVTARS